MKKFLLAAAISVGIVGGFSSPANATDKSTAEISVEFDCDTVSVTSSKDLSNVVVDDGNSHFKWDGLTGLIGTFSHPSGDNLVTVWVKSGHNNSGDGPGYGEKFTAPEQDCSEPTPEPGLTFYPICVPGEGVRFTTNAEEVVELPEFFLTDGEVCPLAGENGEDGEDGVDGINGLDGKNGLDGLNGTNGLDGQNGQNGLDGAIGPVGPTGSNAVVETATTTTTVPVTPLEELPRTGSSLVYLALFGALVGFVGLVLRFAFRH